MINRVFMYSKKEAKKNKVAFSIIEIVMSIIVFLIATFLLVDLNMGHESMRFLVFSFAGIIIYFSTIAGIRLRDKYKAYATTDDGSIYLIESLNNVQGVSRLGNRLPNSLDSVRDVANIAGAATQIIGVKRATDLMQNPNFIAAALANYHYVKGMLFTKIDRVYSVTSTKRYYIINCDYTLLNNVQQFKNKKIKIARAYTGVDDLARLLENLK